MPGDEDAFSAFCVRTIETFTLTNLMFVNAETLASLQIMQSESQPNTQMQGPVTSGSKESLSVFGLFRGLARTSQGRQKLRQIFLRPITNLDILQERQKTISVLLLPQNSSSLDHLVKSFGLIKDMRGVMIHLQKGISRIRGASFKNGVWGSLQGFTLGVLKVLEGLRGLGSSRVHLEIVDKVKRNSMNYCMDSLTSFSYFSVLMRSS
jgi:DNA mismatch repair protein MSH5